MVDKKTLVRQLSEILPLDEDSLSQMISNAHSLPTHSAIADYWIGLLGESPAALDFITLFTTKEEPKKGNQRNPWVTTAPGQLKPKIQSRTRLQNSTTATSTSQLLEKKAKPQSKQSQKREKQNKVDNLKDLEEILKQLEVTDTTGGNPVCNCMARIHPLFDVVPNCLNCGKIICVKEGLRPCSSCGKELIDAEEKKQIIELLELEKVQLEESKQDPNTTKAKKKKFTVSMTAGSNFWKDQESLFNQLEKDLEKSKKSEKDQQQTKEQDKELKYDQRTRYINPDLQKAKKNLENLLNFQANSAERTKIIDQASDFELPTGSNLNIWSSGVEKALQLKKQQKQLRMQETKEKELSGRGKRVLDITIGKDGKAVMREVIADNKESDEADEEIQELEKTIKSDKDFQTDQDLKTVWDYEKDAEKWVKPTYIGHVQASEDSIEKPKWDRVQFDTGDQILEDLVSVL